MAFAGLVIVNIALILANRSRWETLWGSLARHNPFLWWIVGAAIAVLLVAIYVAPVSELFRFAPLSSGQLLLSVMPAAFMLVAIEILKALRRQAYGLRSISRDTRHKRPR